jgi:hypothetical protein
VYVDVTGNNTFGVDDMQIQLTGTPSLIAADFRI